MNAKLYPRLLWLFLAILAFLLGYLPVGLLRHFGVRSDLLGSELLNIEVDMLAKKGSTIPMLPNYI